MTSMAHPTQDELEKKIVKARKLVEVGGLYTHFKNPDKYYVIEFVGILENSEEVCVAYRALYGKGILWVRTLSDFLSEKEVDGEKVKRFRKV